MACKKLTAVLFAAALCSGIKASADEGFKWGLPLSATWGIGSFSNTDMGLDSRTMNAFSLEALPSYKMGSWQFGFHFEYGWQGQITSLADAGGTNLKGNGYLLGVGARKEIFNRLFAQASVDFLGRYNFSNATSAGQDDHLSGPLNLKLKAGYAVIESLPNLTLDLDIRYRTYRNFTVAGVDNSTTTKQFMVGVGVTYQLGSSDTSSASSRASTSKE